MPSNSEPPISLQQAGDKMAGLNGIDAPPSIESSSSSSSSSPTHTLTAPGVHVSLTYEPLSVSNVLDSVRSPYAGALVLFAGTTRADKLPVSSQPGSTDPLSLNPDSTSSTKENQSNDDDDQQQQIVTHLTYSAYIPLALRTLLSIASRILALHNLTAISIVHKLGVCPVGQESILVAVAASHRQEAWKAAEQALEEVKSKVEVWKRDGFENGLEGRWGKN